MAQVQTAPAAKTPITPVAAPVASENESASMNVDTEKW